MTPLLFREFEYEACLGDELVVAQDVVRPLERFAEQVLALLGLALARSHYTPQQLTQHPAGNVWKHKWYLRGTPWGT